jgi:hypothetical protein
VSCPRTSGPWWPWISHQLKPGANWNDMSKFKCDYHKDATDQIWSKSAQQFQRRRWMFTQEKKMNVHPWWQTPDTRASPFDTYSSPEPPLPLSYNEYLKLPLHKFSKLRSISLTCLTNLTPGKFPVAFQNPSVFDPQLRVLILLQPRTCPKYRGDNSTCTVLIRNQDLSPFSFFFFKIQNIKNWCMPIALSLCLSILTKLS